MDIKKTISVIRKICYQDIYKSYWNTIDYAVKCLEKQIPKGVIVRGLGQRYCPICGFGGANDLYCRKCGQKLSN